MRYKFIIFGLLCLFLFCISESIAKLAPNASNQSTDIKEKDKKKISKPQESESRQAVLILGTASQSGVFYPIGKGISQIVNLRSRETSIKCIAYSTNGSEYNIDGVLNGELDIALSRMDLAYSAFKGTGYYTQEGPRRDIRLIAYLYPMPVAIMVKKTSPIVNIYDIKGKSINIGNPGSGKRSISNLLFRAMNWTNGDFSKVLGLSTEEMGNAFCNSDVDAIIEQLGLPSVFYYRMVNECGAKFLTIPPSIISKIAQENTLVEKSIIPGGMYTNNLSDTMTFQLGAVIVSSDRIPKEVIYQFCKTLFRDIEQVKNIHPSLKDFQLGTVLNQKEVIPMHEGVIQYIQDYRDR